MPFLSQFMHWRIQCGLGYSLNVKAELFSGLRPDELGYFNEWTFDPAGSPFRKHRPWLKMLKPLTPSYHMSWVVRKCVERTLFPSTSLDIPFEYLGYFSRRGMPPYHNGFGRPSIFGENPNLAMVCYTDWPPSTDRDEHVFNQAMETIPTIKKHLFVAWADLDGLTHRYGVGSDVQFQRLLQLDNMIDRCVNAFLGHFPSGHFILISDHSMANVDHAVVGRLEHVFGPVSPETYVYFLDSNILRVWVFDDVLRSEVEAYLTNSKDGKALSPLERELYAVTNPLFGDFIYILAEGKIFRDSFWGRKLPAAMHGYHPETNSQKGFVLSDSKLFASDMMPRATDVYKHLKGLLCSDSKA